MILNKP